MACGFLRVRMSPQIILFVFYTPKISYSLIIEYFPLDMNVRWQDTYFIPRVRYADDGELSSQSVVHPVCLQSTVNKLAVVTPYQ